MYPVKPNKEAPHRKRWKVCLYQFCRALQFVLVMLRFPFPVSIKRFQTAVGGAVGVTHEEHARRLMEPHGHPHLLQDEIALKIIARRGQGFRSTSDDDHVRPQDSLPPEKFVHRQTNALIEAA